MLRCQIYHKHHDTPGKFHRQRSITGHRVVVFWRIKIYFRYTFCFSSRCSERKNFLSGAPEKRASAPPAPHVPPAWPSSEMVNVSISETRAGRSQRETAAINLLTSGRDIRSFQGNAALRTDPANEPSFEHSISDPVRVLPRGSRLFRIRNVLPSRGTVDGRLRDPFEYLEALENRKKK